LVVSLAYYRLPHLDAESGYVQVRRYLADKTTVEYLDPWCPRALPDRVVRRLGARPRAAFYEPASVPIELAGARRLLTRPDHLVHLLYGEAHYWYLATLPGHGRGALVATFHQPPPVFARVWRPRWPRLQLRALDAIVATSTAQRDHLAAVAGPDRVAFVPLGANCFYFRPGPAPAKDVQEVLSVGSWLRDVPTLRATLERIAARRPDVRLRVIAGERHLDALRGIPGVRLESGISSARLLDAYRSADVFLHVVAHSTGNTALMEALACGVPVVATDTGGARDYVDDSCAVLLPPDPDRLADAAIGLLDDDARRVEFAEAARENALRFDWPHIAWSLLQVYDRALHSRRPRRRPARARQT
jgi:glycosyltransferase involved in cell wall biosynthesis